MGHSRERVKPASHPAWPEAFLCNLPWTVRVTTGRGRGWSGTRDFNEQRHTRVSFHTSRRKCGAFPGPRPLTCGPGGGMGGG